MLDHTFCRECHGQFEHHAQARRLAFILASALSVIKSTLIYPSHVLLAGIFAVPAEHYATPTMR